MAELSSLGTPPVTPLGPRPKFEFPIIHENPSGWGPCEVPEQFKDTPYQPFSKGDRLGKVRVDGKGATWATAGSFATGSRLVWKSVSRQEECQ